MDSLRDPLVFWITNTVADETKLWYYIRGHGYHKFSTLSWHSQVTLLGGDTAPAIRDEDVIRTPEAMEAYNAATQKNILCSDPIAGVNPMVGLRPSARYYGSIIEWDSHKVNLLTAKFVRAEMPKRDLLLSSNCLQHHTGNACTSVTKYLNIFTRVWTLHKTFSEGDFYIVIRKHCHAILEDEEEGLEIVDPEIFVPDVNDLGENFTRSILDRASLSNHGLGPGDEVLAQARWQKEKEDFPDKCNS